MPRADRYLAGMCLVAGLAAGLLAGCMTVLPGYGPEAASHARARRIVRAPVKRPPSAGPAVSTVLFAARDHWRGVRYRPGGLSRSGLDCSGLVYLTYRRYFGITLPRTARRQARAGRRVLKRSLQSGDLVFFKTGIFTRHVGIFIEKGRFLHVSTQNGVTVSRLENPYWRKHYWKAVRILN